MMFFLNLDENNYVLSIAKLGGGIEADLNLDDYDLSGSKIRAHKWDGTTLTFDSDRYAEIEAEKVETETPELDNISVYDELAEAYQEGVQEA